MIELMLASLLSCSESKELVDSVNQSRVDEKHDLIYVIKLNTKPGCYERPEHNS